MSQVRLNAEAESLKAVIRRREWEDAARRALGLRSGASAVPDALASAEAAGTVGTPLHAKLLERTEEKAAWERKAAEVLRPNAPRVPLNRLEALAEEGIEMGCRLAGLPELTAAVIAARAWSSRAAEVVELFAGADATREPLPQVVIRVRAASSAPAAGVSDSFYSPVSVNLCRRRTALLVMCTLSEACLYKASTSCSKHAACATSASSATCEATQSTARLRATCQSHLPKSRTSARTWTTSKSSSARARGSASSSATCPRYRRALGDLPSIPNLAFVAPIRSAGRCTLALAYT